MYRIVFKRSAEKDLDKINEPFFTRIISKIENLNDNLQTINVKKLKNRNNEYRLRVGDYRVLFYIEDKEEIIKISRILHRKEAYR